MDRPHQLGRLDVVEVRPDQSRRRRSAGPGRRDRCRLRCTSCINCWRQPAVRAEEGVQIERPDEMRVEQHRAGQHADRRERRRAGGREPELVPRFPDFGDVIAQRRRSSACLPIQAAGACGRPTLCHMFDLIASLPDRSRCGAASTSMTARTLRIIRLRAVVRIVDVRALQRRLAASGQCAIQRTRTACAVD